MVVLVVVLVIMLMETLVAVLVVVLVVILMVALVSMLVHWCIDALVKLGGLRRSCLEAAAKLRLELGGLLRRRGGLGGGGSRLQFD